jgi:hypothetical protein
MTEQDIKENDALENEGVEIDLDSEEQVEEAVSQDEAPASAPDDELGEYSKNVQNRIKKLTEKYRKAERDGHEAARLAQQLLEENNKLKTQVTSLDKGYVNSEEARLDAMLESAKRSYREAYESGDTDKLFDAQQQIAKITLAQDRVGVAKRRVERTDQERSAATQAQPQRAQPQAEAPKPDPKAEAWAQKNEWFGSDEVMTYAVFGIHRKLVEEEGFDPQSEEYYSEVDRRIRTEFPHKFSAAKKSGGAQVASAGASASRSTAKSGRRSVKLSPSQIAMAKRLNVPLEEYAKFVKE